MSAYDDAVAAARARAGTAATNQDASRASFLAMLQGFDPERYARQTAGSLYSGLSEELGQTRAARTASLNRRGLFNSDLGGAAETRDFNSRLARGLAGLSVEAGGMEQRRIGMAGDLARGDQQNAQSQQGTYLDLLAGGLDRQQAQKNAKKSRWASLAGGLGALAGGAIGTFLLPGIGTELGASLGGGLGSGVGGMFG